MAEPIIAEPVQTVPQTTTTPPVESPTGQTQTVPNPVQTNPVEPTGDILTRVSKKKEAPKTPEDAAGTFKEFDDIADPVIKQKMIDREKSRIADYTRKTQELASQRSEFEKFQRDSQNWSPERIQKELLNNPQFLQAAQQVASVQNPAGSGLTDEQFSALTPGEKSQLSEMNRQLGELRQQNFLSALNQKDALLQSKYEDYEALKINQGIQDLARMNPIDIREHAYKALYHDKHVQEAYELGKKDRDNLNQTRAQASTSIGSQALASDKRPIRDKRDTDTSYFVKIAEARLAESKGLQAAKR